MVDALAARLFGGLTGKALNKAQDEEYGRSSLGRRDGAMGRRLLPVLAVLAALVAVPLATARHATVGASAQVDANGGSYSLTLRNTGTEAIRCFIMVVPTGATVSSVTGNTNFQLIMTQTTNLAVIGYSLPGTSNTPGPGLAPGDSTQVSFTATGNAIGPAPAGQGMTIRLSTGSCLFSADAALVSPITGPGGTTTTSSTTTTATTTTTAPVACKCSTLTAAVTKVDVSKPVLGADPAKVMILVVYMGWSMHCTGGSGTCSGVLSVHGTAAATQAGLLIDSGVNYNGTLGAKFYNVTCRGSCSAAQTGTAVFNVAGHGVFNAKDLGTKIKGISLIVYRTCSGAKIPLRLRLAFGADGKIDMASSKLSGT